jgi:glycosyltransferase involved in cell wall biosynthesis
LQGRAVFAGQRADVLEIMAQCDVLFSTSRHEGFPNVVLEAMSVGLPVVAVDYSDIRRILPLPWQVTGRDADVMTQTMLRAAQARDDVAARQLEWVRANATIERAAALLESVYGQYVEKAG